MALGRPGDGGLRDLSPDHLGGGPSQFRGQGSVPAAEVERPVFGPSLGPQKPPAQAQIRGL